MNKKNRKFEDTLKERLAEPEYARNFLDVSLEEYENDGNKKAFLRALRYVAEAQGGISHLAAKTNLNRPNLYKVFSAEGNPRLETVGAILHSLGYRLSITKVKEEQLRPEVGKELIQASKDYKERKNVAGPFETAKEADAWLNA